jgi:hypothetical protein
MSRSEKVTLENKRCEMIKPQPAPRSAQLSNNELRRQLGWELIEMARYTNEKNLNESKT